MILVLLAATASAATWTVAADGSGDYQRLSDALLAASTGDEVVVKAGTYSPSTTGENLPYYFVSGLTLRGDDRDRVVLDAEGEETFGTIMQDDVTIEGFTFRGAEETALQAQYAQSTRVADCKFEDNHGASLSLERGDATLSRVAFVVPHGVCTHCGAAMMLWSVSLHAEDIHVQNATMDAGQIIKCTNSADFREHIVFDRLFMLNGVFSCSDATLKNGVLTWTPDQANTVDKCVLARDIINSTVVGAPCDFAVYDKTQTLNTIVAWSQGAGIRSVYAAANLLHENAGGDWSGTDWSGTMNNITGDPMFRSFANDGDWSRYDLRVQASSPAIDAGVGDFPDTDIDGVLRPQDGNGDGTPRADIGAYEYTDDPDTGDPDTGDPDTGHPDTGDPDTGDPDTGDPDTGDPAGVTEEPLKVGDDGCGCRTTTSAPGGALFSTLLAAIAGALACRRRHERRRATGM